jgi:hypothetical protein
MSIRSPHDRSQLADPSSCYSGRLYGAAARTSADCEERHLPAERTQRHLARARRRACETCDIRQENAGADLMSQRLNSLMA